MPCNTQWVRVANADQFKKHFVVHRVHFLLHAHARGIPLGKENETKEKGARNQAHFPLKTRYPAPIGRLPAGLKCAALFLEVSPPYAT